MRGLISGKAVKRDKQCEAAIVKRESARIQLEKMRELQELISKITLG